MKMIKLIGIIFLLLTLTTLVSSITPSNLDVGKNINKRNLSLNDTSSLNENVELNQDFNDNSEIISANGDLETEDLNQNTNVNHELFSQESSNDESQLSVELTNSNNDEYPSWLDLARGALTGLSATGTLNVNTYAGSDILVNTPIEVRNSTNHIVDSGQSDAWGNYSTVLEEGFYNVIVSQDNNITYTSVSVTNSTGITLNANFAYLNITTLDDSQVPVDAQLEVRRNSDNGIEIDGIQSGGTGNIILIVAPNIYDIVAIFNYGSSKDGIVVNPGVTVDVSFTFISDLSGKFGGLEVTSTGYFKMPLTSIVDIYYYSTNVWATGGTTNPVTGKAFWNLAPDVYKVVVSEFSSITFAIVTIQDSIQTNVSVTWGTVLVYQDNTTNTFVELYDQTNTNRLNYGWIDASGKLALTVHAGQYVIRYSGFNYPINVTSGSRQLINSQRNIPVNILNPSLPYSYVTAGRVLANEQTNISIVLTDPDYDYPNLSFQWTPNVGSVTGINSWNRFTYEHQYTSTVTYNAPAVNQTMYVDIFIHDNNGGNFSYRIYLSNRFGDISVNSTQLNGLARQGTFIELYRLHNLRLSYGWADASGWVNFTNILEDEYYLVATEGNVQNTGVFFLNGSESKFVNFKWGLIHVNSTGLNGQLINTATEARSEDGLVYYSSGTTTLSGNGYFTYYLSEGNYSLVGYEFNDLWEYGLTVTAEEEIYHEFKFGVVATYYLDDQSNPQVKFVQVFNLTSGVRENYGWTDSSGLLVMILAPYDNYSITVDHNATLTYIYGNVSNPFVILPNQGLSIGQFINHAPTVSSYVASPTKIDPNQTSVITITASDPDPLDILTYTYIPSVGTITGVGFKVNYTAPATTGFYYLNISVYDPHGAGVNFTRSLSNRVGDISVTLLGYENVTLNGNFVELWDVTTGARSAYGWTTASGLINFPNIQESFYLIRAHASNTWDSETFIPGPDTGLYSKTFRFASIFVNATGGQSQLVPMATEVYYNSVYQSGAPSTVINQGQVQFLLRPDVYDVRGLMINDQWSLVDTNGKEAQSVNITFSWAEFNISVRAGNYMPMDSFVEMYNQSTLPSPIRFTYNWPDWSTGHLVWYGRTGDHYQLRATEGSSAIIINLNATAGNLYNLEAFFGTIRLIGSDINNMPVSVSYSIYIANTTTYVGGGSTGTDGVIFVHLAPGYYDINNGTYLFKGVLISPLQILHFGSVAVNNRPVINAVIPSQARIGPNSTTTIVLQGSDIDFDYPTFFVNVVVSIGIADPGITSWAHKNLWQYSFVYHSPVNSGFYELNITLNDGRGLASNFTLHVSNQQGLINIFTMGNALKPLSGTSISIFNAYTGVTITSGSTNVNGVYSGLLYDDLYNIRVQQHNYMSQNYVWIRNGDIVNITFLWGEITIVATGVNDIPLQNAFVEVWNQPNTVRQTYAWTPVDGKVHFVLAPGIYNVKITPQSGTPITFNNILIEGGSGISLGSAVPIISSPDDVTYEINSTGNTLTWTLDDLNPDSYYITLDSIVVVNSTNWTAGQTVILPIDGLPIGVHPVVLFANDTTGLEQTNVVFITVLSDTTNPSINYPTQITFTEGTINNLLGYTLDDNNPDKYILYRDSIAVSSGNWTAGSLVFNLDSLTIGNYNYQLFINDTFGNSFVSGITLVTVVEPVVDTTPPIITLISPSNESIQTVGTLINLQVNDDTGVNQVLYNWDGGNNLTLLSPYDTNLPTGEGLHILRVYAKDIANHWSSKIFTFVVPGPSAPPAIIAISSPLDQKMNSNEITGKSVQWHVTYFNAVGNSWELKLNGLTQQQGSVTNNSDYSFSLVDLNLGAGLHRLTFIVSVKNYSGNPISAQDIVYITIIKVQSIPTGTTDIDVGGIADTTISLTVDTPVELTVETLPSATPETNSSFQILESSQGAINTGYFLEITISNESAIGNVWINISYATWELDKMGIEDETSLKIYFFDETALPSGAWVPAGYTGVDTFNKIIYANVNHFSSYSAVAFIKDTSGSSTTSTGIPSIGTSSTSTQQGLPGFEFLYAIIPLFAVIPISIKRKKN